MGVDALMPIGELARRAEVPVKTVRHYSDIGIVTPAQRTAGGYRMYGQDQRLRLETITTLRRLGFDLDDICAMVDGVGPQAGLRRQVQAVQTRLRELRRVALVLEAALERDEPATVHLARLRTIAGVADDERAALRAEAADHPGTTAPCAAEAPLPDLPAAPQAGQVDAWLELAALLADGEGPVRAADATQEVDTTAPRPTTDLLGVLHDAMEARSAGVTPDDARADAVVNRLRTAFGANPMRRFVNEVAPDGDLESRRYWRLVARIRGWPEHSPQAQAVDWLVAALRLRCG
ncbi:MerR family transcriptional regulator [soil metagenome]